MKELALRRKVYDRTLKGLMYFCTVLTCALLVFLIGYIFYRGAGTNQLGTADQSEQLY